MSTERFEIVEPTLRGVAATLEDAARKVVDLAEAKFVPYWIIRDSATGAAYVVTPERLREILARLAAPIPADPFPLVEETSDPSELPTVSEWLGRGAPMREIAPDPVVDEHLEAGFEERVSGDYDDAPES